MQLQDPALCCKTSLFSLSASSSIFRSLFFFLCSVLLHYSWSLFGLLVFLGYLYSYPLLPTFHLHTRWPATLSDGRSPPPPPPPPHQLTTLRTHQFNVHGSAYLDRPPPSCPDETMLVIESWFRRQMQDGLIADWTALPTWQAICRKRGLCDRHLWRLGQDGQTGQTRRSRIREERIASWGQRQTALQGIKLYNYVHTLLTSYVALPR